MADKPQKSLGKKIFVFIDKMFDKAQNCEPMDYDGMTIEKDVVYDDVIAPEYGKMDLFYRVQADKKLPVMFYMHGGGFVAGDKHYRRWLSGMYANLGFFVVNINYAVGPERKYPALLFQAYKALEWIGANAEKYNLDLDKVLVGGDSAGGYLAEHVAAVANNPEWHERLNYNGSVRIHAAILNCGMYDVEMAMSKHYPLKLNEKLCMDLTGVEMKDVPSLPDYDILVPSKLMNKDFPQCLLIYAEKDMFCKGQTELLIEQMKPFNIKIETFGSQKLTDNHCYCLSPNASKRCREAIEAIKEYALRVIEA